MQAFGLYSHIRANRTRSILLLGGLFVLVYIMTFAGALVIEAQNTHLSLDQHLARAWGDLIQAAPVVTIGTIAWVGIAYLWHQKMIDAVTGGYDVTRLEEPRLYNLLENLCISRGLPMPKLKIIPNPALNAFASGLNESQYAVSVTSGLMAALDDAELEAVLAHELTHIRNGDVRLLVIALVIAGVLSFIGEMVFRVIFNSPRVRSRNDRKGSAWPAMLIALALVALAWFLSIVIRFGLSRSREYLADAGAVELTHNPDAMISALRKIENRGEIEGATSAVMEMCVDNPRSGFADLFATHPAVEDRVAALVRFAGGHDPGPLAVSPPAPETTIAPDEGGGGPWGSGPAGPGPQSGGPWGSG
jgi:heat shock protein HtpX